VSTVQKRQTAIEESDRRNIDACSKRCCIS